MLNIFSFFLQSEMSTLQSYVTELSEQNEILVQTIEDIESDTHEKVEALETKLANTNKLLKV